MRRIFTGGSTPWPARSRSGINTYATEKKLPLIDLNETFKTAAASSKLFYDTDIHINKKGHELIAQEITKTISTRATALSGGTDKVSK